MNKKILMFYNVENFYPSDENPQESEHSELRNWDDYKYNVKVRKISNVFRFIEEDFGKLPSIIGLAEIGNISVLEDLTKENSSLKDYEIVYQQSNDSRRLSVALLFDNKKYSLIKADFLKFQMDENLAFDTRDILHAELLFERNKLHIFVCHLPSQRNHNAKKEQRNYIFEKLNGKLQELVEKNESVILMGDFNENPDNKSIRELSLKNSFEMLFNENQSSTYHGNKGVCFDQILFTEKTLIEQFNYKNIEAEIYNSPRLRNKDNKNNKFPFRTYSGSRYIGGYSDHFPVILKLLNNSQS